MFKSSKKKLIVSGCSYSDNYATREGIANFKKKQAKLLRTRGY